MHPDRQRRLDRQPDLVLAPIVNRHSMLHRPRPGMSLPGTDQFQGRIITGKDERLFTRPVFPIRVLLPLPMQRLGYAAHFRRLDQPHSRRALGPADPIKAIRPYYQRNDRRPVIDDLHGD